MWNQWLRAAYSVAASPGRSRAEQSRLLLLAWNVLRSGKGVTHGRLGDQPVLAVLPEANVNARQTAAKL